MKSRYIILFLFVALSLFAEEKIKIIKVLDSNLFLTENGYLLTLSNVKTVSIHDPDSIKQQFARRVYKKIKRKIFLHSYMMEQVAVKDSLTIVHLWEQHPFGRTIINKEFLLYGWGKYMADQESDFAKDYAAAALIAQKKSLGIHNSSNFEPLVLPNQALWFSGGLGIGIRTRKSRGNYDVFCLNSSANLRKKKCVYSLGVLLAGDEATTIGAWQALMGRSFYDKYGELVVSIGPSLNKWSYNTESKIGIIRSNLYPGFMFKVQVFAHAPQLLGLGFNFDANINKETTTYTLSLNILLGIWLK